MLMSLLGGSSYVSSGEQTKSNAMQCVGVLANIILDLVKHYLPTPYYWAFSCLLQVTIKAVFAVQDLPPVPVYLLF